MSVRAKLAKSGRIQPIFFNDLGGGHLVPKAEITGSNSVIFSNYFNWLNDFCASQKLPVPENLFTRSSRKNREVFQRQSANFSLWQFRHE